MRRALVLVLALLSMAPTAGDVGGCGSEATLLDTGIFAAARKQEDCERCSECGITNARCTRACDPKAAPDVAIPQTCRPLQHDGKVCLRALGAAACSDYASYVDDTSPTLPGECRFCRDEPAAPLPATFGDGGAP